MYTRRGRLACLWSVTRPWLELCRTLSLKGRLRSSSALRIAAVYSHQDSHHRLFEFYFPFVPSVKSAGRYSESPWQPKVIPMPAPELQSLPGAAQAGTQGEAGRSQYVNDAVTSLMKQMIVL